MHQLSRQEVEKLLREAPAGATIYLIGAGGCGMSGLGHLLLDLGFRVAGSDLVLNREIEQLRSRGAEIHVGHDPAQVAASQACLAVYTSAVRLAHPELQAVQQQKIPLVRRGILLAALMERQRPICVAGMHGKTTTTSLLSFALDRLQAHPSYAVGAMVPQLSPHARLSSQPGAWFVAETDESDGTLREFHPEHAILLNIDEEHLDYFANLEAICREFRAFHDQTRGHFVFCADDARLAELCSGSPRAISYGFNPLASYRAVIVRAGIHPGGQGQFEVWHRGEKLGLFSIRLVGEKNISNATAVIAMLHQLGFPAAEIAKAIADFTGASRRQEELFRDDRFRVFDDYGHHPSEIDATLQALRELGPRRLLVAFQPHRFTRTQHLLHQFVSCFRRADLLWITEVYAASEQEIPGINGARLAEAITAAGQKAAFAAGLEELKSQVRSEMQAGDLVLFLGAGSITQAAHQLASELASESPSLRERHAAELSSLLSPAAVIRRNEPLAKRTTLRVGGTADLYLEPASEADLSAALQFCKREKLPFMLLGRGSNLLIRDGGIRGVVICLSNPHFSRLEFDGPRIHCGAGVRLKTLSVEARRHGLAGLEFLEGIPGSVGGGLRMNAGAMGSWMFEVVEEVRFMDYAGRVHVRPASEVHVEYRGCPLFRDHIALGAVLKGAPVPPPEIEARMKSYSQKRWESQPAAPSAGCIFKNPKTIPAGKLIDELGLKGTRVGGAVVSDVHGNFIVNDGQATARDVLNLIELIRDRARQARGIELQTEVEILGEDA